MSKHKKRKHKRVADPYDDYMQKRHAYWAACAKKGELTEEQAHTCDELEMFVSAVIVFSDISPQDNKQFYSTHTKLLIPKVNFLSHITHLRFAWMVPPIMLGASNVECVALWYSIPRFTDR